MLQRSLKVTWAQRGSPRAPARREKLRCYKVTLKGAWALRGPPRAPARQEKLRCCEGLVFEDVTSESRRA